jgi:PAS domain-containing protein
LFDDREQILAISQSWLEGSGYSREELRRIGDWTARAFGEHSDKVLEHIRGIISEEPQEQPTEMTMRAMRGWHSGSNHETPARQRRRPVRGLASLVGPGTLQAQLSASEPDHAHLASPLQ